MLGIAIFSFNRPNYLYQCLKALEQCTNINDYPIHLFQDNYKDKFSKRVCAHKKDIQDCILIWHNSKFPVKHTHLSNDRIGIANIQKEAKDKMFEHYNYVLFIEDDLVVNKHYILVIEKMIRQFGSNPNVGIMTAHGENRPHNKSKLKKLDSSVDHKWGWVISREKWKRMEPTFLEYYDFVKDCDYMYRPHKQITEWIASKGIARIATSQDGAIDVAQYTSGMFQLNTIVPRAIYIGEKGEHMNPWLYAKEGWGNQELKHYKEDTEDWNFDYPGDQKLWENFKKHMTK